MEPLDIEKAKEVLNELKLFLKEYHVVYFLTFNGKFSLNIYKDDTKNELLFQEFITTELLLQADRKLLFGSIAHDLINVESKKIAITNLKPPLMTRDL